MSLRLSWIGYMNGSRARFERAEPAGPGAGLVATVAR